MFKRTPDYMDRPTYAFTIEDKFKCDIYTSQQSKVSNIKITGRTTCVQAKEKMIRESQKEIKAAIVAIQKNTTSENSEVLFGLLTSWFCSIEGVKGGLEADIKRFFPLRGICRIKQIKETDPDFSVHQEFYRDQLRLFITI